MTGAHFGEEEFERFYAALDNKETFSISIVDTRDTRGNVMAFLMRLNGLMLCKGAADKSVIIVAPRGHLDVLCDLLPPT